MNKIRQSTTSNDDKIICFIQLDSEKNGTKVTNIGYALSQDEISNPNFKPRFVIIRYADTYYWINLKRQRVWRTYAFFPGLHRWRKWHDCVNKELAHKIIDKFMKLIAAKNHA